MRRNGELSIQEVSHLLGKHENTVRNWAREAIAGGGEHRGLRVRRDFTGHYWFWGQDVERIRSKANRGKA